MAAHVMQRQALFHTAAGEHHPSKKLAALVMQRQALFHTAAGEHTQKKKKKKKKKNKTFQGFINAG